MTESKQTPPKQAMQSRLNDWLRQYAEDAGADAVLCEQAVAAVLEAGALSSQAQDRLLELLAILQRLSPDPVTVACAIYFSAYQKTQIAPTDTAPAALRKQFADLLHLRTVQRSQFDSAREHNAEGLRRLLLALVEDIRVVLIALAWQLIQLRHAKGEQAKTLADETMLIYAPLANRLGVWQLKWELEDLSFRYQQPGQYQRVAELVAERRSDREEFIDSFLQRLHDGLSEAGIQADVKGRPKHIYSIWRKMQRKELGFDELFDVRAVRVLVDDVQTCYTVLGLVHTMWQPVPGEFDDYITTPKGNNYRSLHTAVVGAEGKVVEVQIRTFEMHEHAELGVAAHWRYKEGGPNDPAFEHKIVVMRQLLEVGDEAVDDSSLLDSFASTTTEERVYVLTPKGQVVDLPHGSTVLDFAYHIHTEVGHRCRGAKINGHIVTLTQQVKTGDRVEIMTAKHPQPSRDWLNPRLEFIRSGRARAKIRAWFRKEGYEDNLQHGKTMLDAELKRMNMSLQHEADLLERFSVSKLDDIYVAVGNGDLTVGQIINALQRASARQQEVTVESLVTPTPVRQRSHKQAAQGDVVVEGVGNLLTSMAKCCRPIPGDDILGYITRGRGVTIHRADCKQMLPQLRENNPRLIKVQWGQRQGSRYTARIEIVAYDRKELIKDISTTLATDNISVADINSQFDDASDQVRIRLTLRVADFAQLSALLSRLMTVQNVQQVRRIA